MQVTEDSVKTIVNMVRDVPDFPEKGVIFKDIAPVLRDPKAFGLLMDLMADRLKDLDFNKIAAIESRGFLLGSSLATQLGKGLVLVRKKGKLPWKTVSESYSLEYGEATLEIQQDAFEAGDKVVIVDDVLATGGTAAATVKLCERLGAEVVATQFMIELDFLKGAEKLSGAPVDSLIHY